MRRRHLTPGPGLEVVDWNGEETDLSILSKIGGNTPVERAKSSAICLVIWSVRLFLTLDYCFGFLYIIVGICWDVSLGGICIRINLVLNKAIVRLLADDIASETGDTNIKDALHSRNDC